MMRIALLLVFLSPVPPGVAQSSAEPVQERARVRLLAIGGYTAEGDLLRLTPDSVILSSTTMGNVGLPAGAVRRLEILRPTVSAFHGARRGAVWGAVLGLVSSAAVAVGSDRGIIDWQLSVPIISGGILGGAALGAVFLRAKAWQNLPFPNRSR